MLELRGIEIGQGGGVRNVRAGDILGLCRKILQKCKPEHLHGNILLRMPDAMDAKVSKLVDKAKLAQDRLVKSGYTKLSSKKKTAELVEAGIVNLVKQEVPRSSSAWCYKCHCACAVAGAAEEAAQTFRLTMHVAGFCCWDWSSRGKNQGWCGGITNVFIEWLKVRVESQEDFIIAECTRRFKQDIIAKSLPSYEVQSAVFSPLQMGFGVNRYRIYILCLRKARLRWVAPLDLLGMLEKLFFRRSILPGSVSNMKSYRI